MSGGGAADVHAAATAVVAHAPLLYARHVVDAAAHAFQLYGFTADGGADVVDVPQRAQVQPAARADEPGVEVADAVAAVDGQDILRRDGAAAVGDVAARQLDVITANHAAAVNGDILR